MGWLACAASLGAAQDSKPSTPPAVAEGWKLLEQGNVAAAGERARAALKAAPKNEPAVELAVEVEIRRRGARAGLDYYEAWLGKETREAHAPLKRVATAWLRAASQSTNAEVKFEAMRGLAAVGDPEASQAMWDAVAKGSMAEARVLAAAGHDGSVKALASVVQQDSRPNLASIQALGESQNPAALDALQKQLGHPLPEVRATAAEAIARIGGDRAPSLIKPLLNDRSMNVKVRAAGALLRLNDTSGEQILQQQLENSADSPAGRLIAAEAMAGRADAAWISQVRGLLSAEDPHIRLRAAQLLAPHDPVAAGEALDTLTKDANPAIREESVRLAAAGIGADLTELRRMLRHPDPLTPVRAASTILRLTH